MKLKCQIIKAALICLCWSHTGFALELKPLNLIELFTSQGCSSCPPADNWVYQLGKNQRQYQDFISISFHVDYWNYLGWRDPFSSKKSSHRQRSYVRQGFFNYVATPTVLVNGRPYKGWRRNSNPPPPSQQKFPSVTVQRKGNNFQISWPYFTGDQKLWLQGTLLSSSIAIKVINGENAGRTLHHHHVALGLQYATVTYNKARKRYIGTINLKKEIKQKAKIDGFALWISKANENKPIIAVASKLP